MNNEQLMNYQINEQRLGDIAKEMDNIAMFARAYANATDEQRARINRADVQAQLDRYNALKSERLWLEESLLAARINADREAYLAEQQAQQNAYGTRRVVRNPYLNQRTFTPVENQWWLDRPGAIAFDANGTHIMNDDWTISHPAFNEFNNRWYINTPDQVQYTVTTRTTPTDTNQFAYSGSANYVWGLQNPTPWASIYATPSNNNYLGISPRTPALNTNWRRNPALRGRTY